MTALPSPAASPPSSEQIRGLLRAGRPPHVSLFMPTRRPWNETKENRLTMAGLLEEAESTLSRLEASSQFLQPVSALVDDKSFWQNVEEGLAVFAARDHVASYTLPFSVSAQQFVDRRFHVRPLLRALTPDGPFYLLALSQGGVKFFKGSRYAMEEVTLEDTPTSLDEALQFDEHTSSVTFHTRAHPGAKGDSGKRAAMYHGHEDAGDKAYVKEGILRFFRTLDNEVRRLLGQEPTPPPLVLAGTATLRGLYRKVNHYPHLTDDDVEGHYVDPSAADFDVDVLQEQAWSIVEPHYEQERVDARARFEQLSATERATGSLHAVIAAAHDHRIETLFVAETATAWGRFDTTAHEAEIHTKPAPEDVELLNAAVAWTLDGDGTVYVVEAEAVPSRTPAAAILRY